MAQQQLSVGERPLWPEGGMGCPVPNCNKNTVYVRYDRFSEHWARVHLPFSQVFQCLACNVICNRATEGRQHTRRSGTQHLCARKIVANPRYIGSGGIPKPRFPSKAEREATERRKEEEALQKMREKEAEKERDREERRRAAKNEAMDMYFLRTEVELDYEDDISLDSVN